MKEYLLGALPWLYRRANLLQTKLTGLSVPASIQSNFNEQMAFLGATLEQILNRLDDPTLTHSNYTYFHLIDLKRWVRLLDDIEALFLPLIENWSNDSETVQSLLSRICGETHLPLSVRPIIAIYSTEYFYVFEGAQIIYIPRLEGHFLLHIPDLYHEIGHVLLAQVEEELWGDLKLRVSRHFNQKQIRGKLENDPLAIKGAYVSLEDSWNHHWLIEFTCDVFAAYLCGPAYAASHIHLCASKGSPGSIYHPETDDETALHPADAARWHIIAYVLDDLGWISERRALETRWNSLVNIFEVKCPTHFHIAYPESLLREIQEQIKQGLSSLKIPTYTKPIGNANTSNSFADILNEAWTIFWTSPESYNTWEETASPIK